MLCGDLSKANGRAARHHQLVLVGGVERGCCPELRRGNSVLFERGSVEALLEQLLVG